DRISVDGEPVPVADGVARTPLLLVPALGIHAWTFDIMPNRSMVRYLMARGFEVYLLDWGRPSASHRELRLDTYVNDWLPAAVRTPRGPIWSPSPARWTSTRAAPTAACSAW